jgi:hypothetical protein
VTGDKPEEASKETPPVSDYEIPEEKEMSSGE